MLLSLAAVVVDLPQRAVEASVAAEAEAEVSAEAEAEAGDPISR